MDSENPAVQGPGGDETQPRTLYVGNLDAQMTEEFLLILFSQIGPVKGCKIIHETSVCLAAILVDGTLGLMWRSRHNFPSQPLRRMGRYAFHRRHFREPFGPHPNQFYHSSNVNHRNFHKHHPPPHHSHRHQHQHQHQHQMTSHVRRDPLLPHNYLPTSSPGFSSVANAPFVAKKASYSSMSNGERRPYHVRPSRVHGYEEIPGVNANIKNDGAYLQSPNEIAPPEFAHHRKHPFDHARPTPLSYANRPPRQQKYKGWMPIFHPHRGSATGGSQPFYSKVRDDRLKMSSTNNNYIDTLFRENTEHMRHYSYTAKSPNLEDAGGEGLYDTEKRYAAYQSEENLDLNYGPRTDGDHEAQQSVVQSSDKIVKKPVRQSSSTLQEQHNVQKGEVQEMDSRVRIVDGSKDVAANFGTPGSSKNKENQNFVTEKRKRVKGGVRRKFIRKNHEGKNGEENGRKYRKKLGKRRRVRVQRVRKVVKKEKKVQDENDAPSVLPSFNEVIHGDGVKNNAVKKKDATKKQEDKSSLYPGNDSKDVQQKRRKEHHPPYQNEKHAQSSIRYLSSEKHERPVVEDQTVNYDYSTEREPYGLPPLLEENPVPSETSAPVYEDIDSTYNPPDAFLNSMKKNEYDEPVSFMKMPHTGQSVIHHSTGNRDRIYPTSHPSSNKQYPINILTADQRPIPNAPFDQAVFNEDEFVDQGQTFRFQNDFRQEREQIAPAFAHHQPPENYVEDPSTLPSPSPHPPSSLRLEPPRNHFQPPSSYSEPPVRVEAPRNHFQPPPSYSESPVRVEHPRNHFHLPSPHSESPVRVEAPRNHFPPSPPHSESPVRVEAPRNHFPPPPPHSESPVRVEAPRNHFPPPSSHSESPLRVEAPRNHFPPSLPANEAYDVRQIEDVSSTLRPSVNHHVPRVNRHKYNTEPHHQHSPNYYEPPNHQHVRPRPSRPHKRYRPHGPPRPPPPPRPHSNPQTGPHSRPHHRPHPASPPPSAADRPFRAPLSLDIGISYKDNIVRPDGSKNTHLPASTTENHVFAKRPAIVEPIPPHSPTTAFSDQSYNFQNHQNRDSVEMMSLRNSHSPHRSRTSMEMYEDIPERFLHELKPILSEPYASSSSNVVSTSAPSRLKPFDMDVMGSSLMEISGESMGKSVLKTFEENKKLFWKDRPIQDQRYSLYPETPDALSEYDIRSMLGNEGSSTAGSSSAMVSDSQSPTTYDSNIMHPMHQLNDDTSHVNVKPVRKSRIPMKKMPSYGHDSLHYWSKKSSSEDSMKTTTAQRNPHENAQERFVKTGDTLVEGVIEAGDANNKEGNRPSIHDIHELQVEAKNEKSPAPFSRSKFGSFKQNGKAKDEKLQKGVKKNKYRRRKKRPFNSSANASNFTRFNAKIKPSTSSSKALVGESRTDPLSSTPSAVAPPSNIDEKGNGSADVDSTKLNKDQEQMRSSSHLAWRKKMLFRRRKLKERYLIESGRETKRPVLIDLSSPSSPTPSSPSASSSSPNFMSSSSSPSSSLSSVTTSSSTSSPPSTTISSLDHEEPRAYSEAKWFQLKKPCEGDKNISSKQNDHEDRKSVKELSLNEKTMEFDVNNSSS